MNIKKLLEMQKELDKEILEKSETKEYPFKNIKLSLLTEIGELANEWQGFKYWKKNKEINREKLLEEWSDCFHFALSLENGLKQVSEHCRNNIQKITTNFDADLKKYYKENLVLAFISTYEDVITEQNILISIITLGLCLDITLDEMEASYLKKNTINHKRQAEEY